MNTRNLFGRLAHVFSVSCGTRRRPRRRNHLGTIPRLELLEARTLLAGVAIAQLTDTLDVVSGNPSISGDGTKIAFESKGNLTGNNVDGNSEIFLFDTTSSSFTQITNTTGPSISSYAPQISGDGAVIAFHSGDNAVGNVEIFVFNTITGAIAQVTDSTRGGGHLLGSVSGNGGTIVFTSDADLTGGNIDGNREVFLFDTSTSTLTQVTNTTNGFTSYSSISSDGTSAAFESEANLTGNNEDGNSEIFVLDVATGTIKQVTDTTDVRNEHPSINGDGSRLAFVSRNEIALLDITTNTLTLVTDNADNYNPAINNDGTKIAFTGGFLENIFLFDATAGSLTQITDETASGVDAASINSDGTQIAFWSHILTPTGEYGGEITLFDTTTSSFTHVTRTVLQVSIWPSISSDGTKVAFESTADLAGNNADGSFEIFLLDTSTDAVIQITDSSIYYGNFVFSSEAANPAISGDGTTIVFSSWGDLTGDNADGSREIFLFDTATSSLMQVTNSAEDAIGAAINSDGTKIVFSSSANLIGRNDDGNEEIFLFDRVSGAVIQVTDTLNAFSREPSISGDGNRIAFESTANLTGNNSEGHREIFVFDAIARSFTQVTERRRVGEWSGTSISSDGNRIVFGMRPYSDRGPVVYLYDTSTSSMTTVEWGTHASISGDGARVAFESIWNLPKKSASASKIFLFDVGDGSLTQVTQAVGGVGHETYSSGSYGPSINGDGTKIAFHSTGPGNGLNLDGNLELFLATIGLNGDYNGDGTIDQPDLDLVMMNWGKPAFPAPDGWVNDLPGGIVDQAELDAVLINWGASPPADEATQQAVPESQPVSVAAIKAVAATRAKAREAKLRMDDRDRAPASRDHVFDELARHRAGLRSLLQTSDLLRFEGEQHSPAE